MANLDAASIRTLLGEAGLALELFDEIDSTNTWLLEREFGERPALPRLAVAARQTAGRGRRGRTWIAEPGRSACLSLAFESFDGPRPGLSLAVGCAVAGALSGLTDGIALKWPNDLLRRGLKCGGILIETRPGRTRSQPLTRIVVGIGLNMLAPTDTDALLQPAGGLFDDGRSRPAIEAVIALAARACAGAVDRHATEGLATFVSEWERFDAWRGREVEVRDADQVLMRGTALGLAPDGSLKLATPDGERWVASGDVSLRRSASRPVMGTEP